MAIRDFGVHRVEIRVASSNVRSRRIPERLGFTHEGKQREASPAPDGSYDDLEIYSVLDREWRALNPSP